MKLFFIVNPISGGVNKELFLDEAEKLCKKYGIDLHIYKTTGTDDEQRVKQELSSYKPNKVVSVGGDGTTLFTALVLLDTNYPMGIIPLGSANGMATELFVNPKPIEALREIIMSEIVAGLDLLVINDKYHSMHIGDVGVNAQIVESYAADPKRGMATYSKYFLEELSRLNPFQVDINIDGNTFSEVVLMVGICNARKYGTGVPLNIQGNPMDGLFEIVLITKIDGKSLIKAGLSRFNDNFSDNQSGRVLAGKYAEVTFDKPRLLQLDGEVIGKFKNIKIKMLEGSVKLITNRENLYLKN
ncbi:MAG: diacylglycerol kinase family protein [Bacteroidota bacterium]